MIDKAYYKLIEETRDDQTIHSIELVEEEEFVDAVEVNITAEQYVKDLLADGAGRAGGANNMDYGPRMKQMKKEAMHVTAPTVVTLSDKDGMTDEFLFNQPSHGGWLEEVTQ